MQIPPSPPPAGVSSMGDPISDQNWMFFMQDLYSHPRIDHTPSPSLGDRVMEELNKGITDGPALQQLIATWGPHTGGGHPQIDQLGIKGVSDSFNNFLAQLNSGADAAALKEDLKGCFNSMRNVFVNQHGAVPPFSWASNPGLPPYPPPEWK